MGFLQQQGRSRSNSENRLVDSRNGMGETPLLRAASVGKIPVLKVPLCNQCMPAVFTISTISTDFGLFFEYNIHYNYRLQCIIYAIPSSYYVFANYLLTLLLSSKPLFCLQYLLEEGSDPFCTDRLGNTIFIILARCSHIWGLHFVYTALR